MSTMQSGSPKPFPLEEDPIPNEKRKSLQIGSHATPVYIAQYEFTSDDQDFHVEVDEVLKIVFQFGYDQQDLDWWTVKNKEGKEGYYPREWIKEDMRIQEHPENLEIVTALFDLSPRKQDELELKKGDQIKVIDKKFSGWWNGTNLRTNQTGLFPTNYIQLSQGKKTQSLTSTSAQKVFPFHAIAIANYMPSKKIGAQGVDEELNFRKNTKFVIICCKSQGWFYGHLEDNPESKGLIPGNYIEPLPTPVSARKKEQKPTQVPSHNAKNPPSQNPTAQPDFNAVLTKAPPPPVPSDSKVQTAYGSIRSENAPLLGGSSSSEKSGCCIIV